MQKGEWGGGVGDYQIAFDHVLGNFITERDELFLRQILGDLVLHAEVAEYLASSGPADAVDVLERVLDALIVRDLHTSDTSAPDA